MSRVFWRVLALVAGATAVCGQALAQSVIERPKPFAGEVLSIRGGEELQLKQAVDWRTLVASQDVIGGDTVRTNATGALAILFEDRTQVRVGRNSTLVVKDVARSADGTTKLELQQGSIWARAARGGSGVRVETAAAAAAIRGTDWSLTTEGKRTSLVVLDGEVELKNPQGAVTVRRGEGAEAVVGQAPRKVFLVNLDAREQLALYRDLSDSFSELTATALPRPAERAARASALGRPEAARTADDWLTLAETGLAYDGSKAAERALLRAEAGRLSPGQSARAELVRCFLDARERRWAQAAARCRRAAPRLDASRRATAVYLGWAAAREANPADKTPPPAPKLYENQASGVLARASVESFLEGPKKGIEVLEKNLARFPDDVMMRAGRGLLYFMAGDKAKAKAAIDEALALDPDDFYALVARARYRHAVQSDLKGALADLKRAQEIAPGSDVVWLETSFVEGQRDAVREAEAAHLKAIELNPASPLNHLNYAVFLTENGRLAEAEAEIAAAEAIEPGGYFNLYSRGYLQISQGKTDEGVQKLLGAAAISPEASDVQIALAVANYQSGNLGETEQALDSADQFDADDPLTPTIRSIIAVDQYRADDAILSAREALRRRQARGGDFASIDANRQNGSFVGSSLRFLGLEEWGRYYGDRVADAFASSAYFDQAIVTADAPFAQFDDRAAAGEVNVGPTAFSSLIQGLLVDPLSVASSERRTTLAYHPFAEVAAETGLIKRGGSYGWRTDTVLQGVTMQPFPAAIYADVTFDRPDSPARNDRADQAAGVTLIGAKPTPYDNVSLFNVISKTRTGNRLLDGALGTVPDLTPDDQRALVTFSGAAWAHEFSDRNVLQVMVGGSTVDQRLISGPFGGLPLDQIDKSRQRDFSYGVSHLLGLGDVTLRYGAEGSHSRYRLQQFLRLGGVTAPLLVDTPDGDAWRVYGDAVWDATRDLKLEAGLFASALSVGPRGGDDRYEPRLGVAWQPFDGQWLRAAYRRDSLSNNILTLAPATTVGITPNQIPLSFGGRTETIAARWDAEWNAHLFTALDYQRQRAESLSLDLPESIQSFDVERARIDRLRASANIWLTHGLGVFASYTRSWSELRSVSGAIGPGDPVPFLPKHAARAGVAFVHPSMVKVTVAQNFAGARIDALGQKLDDIWTTDASLTWELFDKRLALRLDAFNVFDRRVELFGPVPRVAPLDGGELLGSGRTVMASARVRL